MKGDHRLTIAGMLWAVAVAGFWLASLRSASVLWTTLTATMTLAALLTGVLASVVTRGRGRAFWLGFALFGWVYLIFVNWDWVGGQFGHDLTGGLSDWAEQVIPPVPSALAPLSFPTPARGTTAVTSVYLEAVQQRSIQVGNFVQIGRMTLSLLFATAGGLIGRTLSATTAGPSRDEPAS